MRLAIAALLAGVVVAGVSSQTPAQAPLAQFSGEYRIDSGATGRVRISPALGGTYAEWEIRFDEPEHELRMFLGLPNPDGDYPVWRFEQAPAPAVAQEGVARFQAGELVAEFTSPAPGVEKILRERWRLTDGELEFSLEAGTQGAPPQRIGGFTASRE